MRYAILITAVLVSINSSAFCQNVKKSSIGLTGGISKTSIYDIKENYFASDEIKDKYLPSIGYYFDYNLIQNLSINLDQSLSGYGFHIIRSREDKFNPIGYDINARFYYFSSRAVLEYVLFKKLFQPAVLFGIDYSCLILPKIKYTTQFTSFEISETATNLDRYMKNWHSSLVYGLSFKIPGWDNVSFVLLGEHSLSSPVKKQEPAEGDYLIFPNAYKFSRISLLTKINLY